LLNRQNVFIFGCGLLLVSQIFSPFLLSLSMWIMVYAALVRTNAEGNLRLNLRESFQNFFKNPIYWSISLLFGITLISGFWSSDTQYWLERTQIRLPFFILPLAFANRPPMSKRQWNGLCAFFLVAIFSFGVGVLVNYRLHFEEIMNNLSVGGAIPVPRNHIRFSLLVAMGVAVGWLLFRRRFFLKFAAERWIWAGMAIFLFVLAHVLAVRSGLVAVYVVVLWLVFQLIFQEKKYKIGFALAVVIISMPMLAVKFSSSLRTKIGYMIWDNTRGNEFSSAGYSDTDRLVSLRGGWQLFLENPILGVGSGDLPTEMRRVISEKNPAYNKDVKLPHNQFIYILAATGLFGFLGSLFAFFCPIYLQKRPKEPLFVAAMLILLISFLVEYTIEGTYGAVFAVFFTLFFGIKSSDLDEI
jgi:O-antigen ligase